ncbi:MAG: hypothetical protein FJW23_00470 [Acidimicrobiia bacterium]|nr:hypothetical protein [Acidimicrobiia bacterium]
MITRLALRTLAAHPVRTAVLAAGFGTGVSVMAILLGVGQVVLQQARSPLLSGGGDVIVTGMGRRPLEGARLLLIGALATPPLAPQTRAVSPNSSRLLYLVTPDGTVPVAAQGGVPSQERALGDPEVGGTAEWTDTPADLAWTTREPGDLLRAIDAFHPIPHVPARAASWAEWLYFNGQAAGARFYLTFLVGARLDDGRRAAGVRLQLERNGRIEAFSGSAPLTDDQVARAPDLSIGGNHVRLSGLEYTIELDLEGDDGRRAKGTLVIEADPGRHMPPIELLGARGWKTGYVVPVMSGRLDGELTVGPERVSFGGGSGYHDHNWGFWEGVSWQWGQVRHEDVSIVFGRVFPPPDAADVTRIPGFLGVLGPDGPLGYATRLVIEETNLAGSTDPARITIRGRSSVVDVELAFDVRGLERTRLPGPMASSLSFLQMRGDYTVSGRIGDRTLDFRAAGSAETFRGE